MVTDAGVVGRLAGCILAADLNFPCVMPDAVTRRRFLNRAAAAGAGLCLAQPISAAGPGTMSKGSAGVAPQAAGKPYGEWPVFDSRDEEALLDVLRSGKWGRTAGGTRVKEFEAAFASLMQAKHCIATSSGTTALLSALGALNVGPGDEVILPPYTFVATFNAITQSYALPVFVDVDAATFQIDPAKIPAAITSATRVLLPVHIGGSPCDIDAVVELGRARGIAVLEDACQAPLASVRGRPVGSRGIGGCFSFQAFKNLTSGEGGAVLTNDDNFADLVFNHHTPGNPRRGALLGRASNFRLTEFQAGLLLSQMARLEAQASIRDSNAAFLTSMLERIPGITPARFAGGATRGGWHLYMFRYDRQRFAGLSRARFIAAMAGDGVALSSGYASLNTSAHVKAIAANPHYQRIYGREAMARWLEKNQCPVNDRLVGEAVWIGQSKLLGSRGDVRRIAEKIAAVQRRAGQLARA